MCVVSFNLEEIKLESFYKHKILDNNIKGVYFYFVRLCLKMSQLIIVYLQRSILILGRAVDLHLKLYLTFLAIKMNGRRSGLNGFNFTFFKNIIILSL